MSLPVSEIDSSLELNLDQWSLLRELKKWVETEAEFYGRFDEDFLVLFLHSCDFDLELSKKTLHLYYEARIKYPEWWAGRDINHPQIMALINIKAAYLFLDSQHSNHPTVGVVHFSRFGNDPSILSPAGKFFTCGLDMTTRRRNCQLNGLISIYDLDNLHGWMVWKALWPPFLKSMINAFWCCLPFKINKVVFVNAPGITSVMAKIFHSFLPEMYRNKLQFCRSWKDIGQFIPLELIPEEYGGQAGPVKLHEDAAVAEMLALRDYFVDDNKYGFQPNYKPTNHGFFT